MVAGYWKIHDNWYVKSCDISYFFVRLRRFLLTLDATDIS